MARLTVNYDDSEEASSLQEEIEHLWNVLSFTVGLVAGFASRIGSVGVSESLVKMYSSDVVPLMEKLYRLAGEADFS